MRKVALDWLTRTIRHNQRRDYDVSIVISGAKRRGKSALAWRIAHEVQPDFRGDVQQIYTYPQFVRAVKGGARYEVIWCDEAVSFLLRSEWNTRETRNAMRMISQFGYKNYCYIFCLPRFADLVSPLLNDEVRYWLHVARRGEAVMLRRYDNPLATDAWNTETYRRLVDRALRRSNGEGEGAVLRCLEMHPQAYGRLRFPDFPPEAVGPYLQLKEGGLAGENDPEERGWHVWGPQLALALQEQEFPTTSISEWAGCSAETVRRAVRALKDVAAPPPISL